MPFYRRPPDLLSQGDIVGDIPWGLIEAPVTLCRPIERGKPHGSARYSTIDPFVMKGSPPPWNRDPLPEVLHAIGWQGFGIVLWHDCQIDKAENQERERADKAFAAIAPVLPVESLQSDNSDNTAALKAGVRDGRHQSYFFLPAVKNEHIDLPESFVNLRFIWSVRQSALQKRFASLDLQVLPSLYEKLFVFFTRFRLDLTPVCLNCGTAVSLIPAAAEN